MTDKTMMLINDLTEALYESKCLLLQGGVGVGKTFIAKEIAEKIKDAKFNSFQIPKVRKQPESEMIREIVPFHASLSYEEFINGISVKTDEGHLLFEYSDRIFLNMIKRASEEFTKGSNTKVVMILDDIQRGDITDLMGDVIALMDPHKLRSYTLCLNSGMKLDITPNFYIIATMNITENVNLTFNMSVMRRFYTYTINSDIGFIDESSDSHLLDMYNKVKSIVNENLDLQFKSIPFERIKYEIGHGYFNKNTYIKQVEYQIIPLLKQYMHEGILEKSADIKIEQLEELLKYKYTTNKEYANLGRVKCCVTEIEPDKFVDEFDTNKPLENLIGRIKKQGIFSDVDIENSFLFNEHIAYRERVIGGVSYKGYLVAGEIELDKFRREAGDKRRYYDKDMYVVVRGKRFFFTAGMQPKEYTQKIEELRDSERSHIGETTSPGGLLFLIIKFYYKTFIDNCQNYLLEQPEDTNISLLNSFAEKEWSGFSQKYTLIVPDRTYNAELGTKKQDQVAEANLKANREVRTLISKLKLLWCDLDEELENDELDKIKVKGVFRTMEDNAYKEYITTMDSLNINQMILQGPPGTSKTYTAKEFLKYISKGIDNDEFCSDADIEDLQINDYYEEEYCNWIKKKGEMPPIAWDIVQFHPSYGYEDFIRGIEVSTKEIDEGGKKRKYVSYDTVNKTLGNIANLASIAKVKKEEGKVDIETKFFLIIDEINRANLATVFGELIYGLEYRGEGVATPYIVNKNNKIKLPDNLYIVGTMNTADKSIGGIDYAIRRRFLFFSQLPDEKVILNYKAGKSEQDELNKKAVVLFKNVGRLFETDNLSPEYYVEDVQIGHTYFLVSSEDQLYKRFAYQIIPILREYYKDGIFRFQIPIGDLGFDGLLNCICGNISVFNNEKVIKDIFEKLLFK